MASWQARRRGTTQTILLFWMPYCPIFGRLAFDKVTPKSKMVGNLVYRGDNYRRLRKWLRLFRCPFSNCSFGQNCLLADSIGKFKRIAFVSLDERKIFRFTD